MTLKNAPEAAVIPIVGRRPSARHRGAAMWTIGDLTRQWVESRVARREIMVSTRKAYRDALRYFCECVGRSTPARAVTRADVERFTTEQATHTAQATLRERVAVVHRFFKWAVEAGYLKSNPCLGLRLPRKPRSVPRGLPDEMVGRVIDAARDTREELIVSLMVREGLRAIEVSRLEMADVDRGRATMRLVGKGGHERVVPLSAETARLVDAYTAEERGRGSGRLIRARVKRSTRADDGVSPETVATLVSHAMKRAQVPESGHALRHTFAYGMLDAGASVRHVQIALGHVSLVTTQVYLPRTQVEELRQFVGKKDYRATA